MKNCNKSCFSIEPHHSYYCGFTPAERHYGRQLRTRLHLLIPGKTDCSEYQKGAQQAIQVTLPGQKVLSRNFVGTRKWKLGVIYKKIGRRTYIVKL